MLNSNTEIKANDKGKLFGPLMGDQGGEPCEKLTWSGDISNAHLTIFNLKMLPSFDVEEKHIPKIHPKYLACSSDEKVKKAHYKLDNLRSVHRFTDDSFFTGELIKAILYVFFDKTNKNLSFDAKCNLLTMIYNKNLRKFMETDYNARLAKCECGGGTFEFLSGKSYSGKNKSNRNGCAMKIPLVGIFADSLSELWKIVWASIRNTHNHQHSFDAARSVASMVFMARGGLGQKSMANYINLEFRKKYTQFVKENNVEARKKSGYSYQNQDHFLNFDMDNCTLQSVYGDRFGYKYTETAIDTVVVALRIICVAGSFYEAWALAKSYGGDADTLQAIVLAMAAVVFGVPEEFQTLTKTNLAIYEDDSPEISGYARVSDEMDKQFSSRYPENIPLDAQLKQTLDMINDIIKGEKRDVDTIEKSLGFNYANQVDKLLYFKKAPYEFFWDNKPKTVLSCFVAIPIILICLCFYFLPANPASISLIVICIFDFIAFHFTSKKYIDSRINKLQQDLDLLVAGSKLKTKSQNTEILNSKNTGSINIMSSIIDISNTGNETTSSNEFKDLIKSIIEEWNFNLNPKKEYDLNQRKDFGYESDGQQPEFNKENYTTYLKDIKSFYQQKLSETKEQNEKNKIQNQINQLTELTPQQMYEEYIAEEKAFYKKVNEHNKSTAQFKTHKKLEKLENLTPERIGKINVYIKQINGIAEKCGIEERIEFNQEEFLKWQKTTKEQMSTVLSIPKFEIKNDINI